ncbi:MAG: DNA repair protein RadA, partial [Deltaproteobacteria bacterium]|nr:DNA repair protein RadA [Deltaproteobacteria bacterium]
VDTVLYFEGDKGNPFRILRAVKNRFGSANEIGLFEMVESGLKEVDNPSELFLSEKPDNVPGSVVTVSLEGTRPLLVEIQALVSPTVFGVPRRTVVGADFNKVLLIAAVLEKKASVTLTNHDIFIKVAGGMRINEPATDLATALALASNFRDKAIDGATVIIGELGLAGEVRSVVMAEQRVMEAKKLGFKRCILPKDNALGLKRIKGVELIGVATLREALDVVLGESSVKG